MKKTNTYKYQKLRGLKRKLKLIELKDGLKNNPQVVSSSLT